MCCLLYFVCCSLFAWLRCVNLLVWFRVTCFACGVGTVWCLYIGWWVIWVCLWLFYCNCLLGLFTLLFVYLVGLWFVSWFALFAAWVPWFCYLCDLFLIVMNVWLLQAYCWLCLMCLCFDLLWLVCCLLFAVCGWCLFVFGCFLGEWFATYYVDVVCSEVGVLLSLVGLVATCLFANCCSVTIVCFCFICLLWFDLVSLPVFWFDCLTNHGVRVFWVHIGFWTC